jgi:hypothetical protein
LEVFILSKSSSNIPFDEPINNGLCFFPLDEKESQGSTKHWWILSASLFWGTYGWRCWNLKEQNARKMVIGCLMGGKIS